MLAEPPALELNLPRQLAARWPRRRAAAHRLGLRSRHPAQRAHDPRGRGPRGRAGRGPARPRVPGRRTLRRDASDVLGHRRRRGRAGGEPAWASSWSGRPRTGRRPSPSPARCRRTCSRPRPSSPTPRAQHRRAHRRGAPAPAARGSLGLHRPRPPGRGPDAWRATSSRSAIPGRSARDRDDPPSPQRHLQPEPFLESDAPEILAEAQKAVAAMPRSRARGPSASFAT